MQDTIDTQIVDLDAMPQTLARTLPRGHHNRNYPAANRAQTPRGVPIDRHTVSRARGAASETAKEKKPLPITAQIFLSEET